MDRSRPLRPLPPLRMAAFLVALTGSAGAARADELAAAMRAALARHGASLVRVEATVTVPVDRLPGVPSGSRRTHQVSAAGVVADGQGLVAIDAAALDPAGDVYGLMGSRARAEVLQLSVVGQDGRAREAVWLGRREEGGLAFARVRETGRAGLTAVSFAGALPEVGEPVFVLSLTAHTQGRAPCVELARLSFKGEGLAGLTPRLPHALGGLVVDAAGNPLGLLGSPLPLPTDADLLRPDLLADARAGYLIPGERLKPWLATPPQETPQAAGGRRQRSWLGIQHTVLTPELAEARKLGVETGILVDEVFPGGPGQQAGLQANDVLLQLDGEPIDLDPGESFDDWIGDYLPGTRVTLGVRRGKERKTLEVELAEGPVPPALADRLALPEAGLLLRVLTFFDRRELGFPAERPGAVVVELDPDGAASRAGLHPGDVLLEIAGQPVASLQDARERLAAPGAHPVKLKRREAELTLTIRR